MAEISERMSRDEERSLRQEWRTPPEFWNVLDAEFQFQIDAAASEENALCDIHYSVERNAFKQDWGFASRVYCNPGFSDFKPWMTKCYVEAQKSPDAVVVMMCLVAPSTEWYRWVEKHAYEIRHLSPRVQFLPPPGVKPSSNPRECAVAIFRRVPTGWPGARVWTWQWKAGK